jgi:predicted enzyme related to lactoylglutathione lyase
MDRRVTGIGGVFFKAKDPGPLSAWYQRHLGVPVDANNSAMFHWRDDQRPDDRGMTVWAAFPDDTDYFGEDPKPFMINYRVDDLDAVLEALRSEGVWIDDHREEYEYGRFAWIADPEGNRIELWEPPRDRDRA